MRLQRGWLTTSDGVPLVKATHEATKPHMGVALLLHGITADMSEGGMYVRLSDELAAAGFTVLRFSFRGHGGSGGTAEGMTIAGEMLDLQAALERLENFQPTASAVARLPFTVVAASFGAVPLLLSLPLMAHRPDHLVLWNPVLDLIHTFIHPELPWGQANFGGAQVDLLPRRGHLVIDDNFKLGRVAYEEMRHYGQAPAEYFIASKMPALVVHGDQDTYVSYDIARSAATDRQQAGGETVFHTVVGSDHGFDSREREDEAIRVTVDWIAGQSSE